MGRGKAPCCNKSQVVKGKWTLAEDLKLTSFIQKHGHDNWRALPRLAGLLRCGKSCRLRWVNYLRPDLKRGNFTKQEEETIIQLHQSLGNRWMLRKDLRALKYFLGLEVACHDEGFYACRRKWSKIASHFPGRTDNEIKNVWNTHLRKRLTKKADESKQNGTLSLITSCITIESSPENHNIGIDGQIKLLPRCDGSTARIGEMMPLKTSFAPNEIVANQVTQLKDSESFNKCGSSDQPDLLFDSSDIDQLEQFAMREEPNPLESLLSPIDDPDWALTSQNTQHDSTEKKSSHEPSLEPDDIGLWSNMLNYDVIPTSAKPIDKEADTVEAPMSDKSMNATHEYYRETY